MPDNVVPFRSRAVRESQEKEGQEKKAASDLMRARMIRRRLEDRPKIRVAMDRFHVARNLSGILHDMELQSLRSEKLLRDLGMGQKGDSTKQLYNYVLPPDAVFEESIGRIDKLTKTAEKYLRIAEAAADAMKIDRDQIILRLFENTSYQVAEDELPDEALASLDQMRQLLVSIGDAAIRHFDLDDYQETLQSCEIGWDIDGSFGNFPTASSSVFLIDRVARHVSYLGYVPTILLYRRPIESIPIIEGEAFQIDFTKDSKAHEHFMFDGKELPKRNRLRVTLDMESEIWFGVAPMESRWSWRPIFEKRISLIVRGFQRGKYSVHIRSYDPQFVHCSRDDRGDPPSRLVWLYFYSLLPKPKGEAPYSASISPHIDSAGSIGPEDISREKLEGRWFVVLDQFDWSALEFDDDVEIRKGQFYYEPIDLASCAKYLSQLHDPNDWDEFEGICQSISLNQHLWAPYEDGKKAWYSTFGLGRRPMPHLRTPIGSIARAIEMNLLDADADKRLDNVLFETVAKRLEMAQHYYRLLVQKRDNQIASLLESWEAL